MKQKWSKSIGYWAHNVNLTFGHTHVLDHGFLIVKFSNSRISGMGRPIEIEQKGCLVIQEYGDFECRCVVDSSSYLSWPWTTASLRSTHYNDVIMSTMASQITSLTIVYSTVYSRRRSKKASKLHVTGVCEWNSLVTGEFPAQKASNAENVSIWWRHHANASSLMLRR